MPKSSDEGSLARILARKLTPIMAFGILWTLLILTFFNWNYFNLMAALFLLTPVIGVLVLIAIGQYFSYRKTIARMGMPNSPKASHTRIKVEGTWFSLDESQMATLTYVGNSQSLKLGMPVPIEEMIRELRLQKEMILRSVNGLAAQGILQYDSGEASLTGLGVRIYTKLQELQ